VVLTYIPNIRATDICSNSYESAWLADLVAAYILEQVDEKFSDTHFFGMYRDDGLVVFNSKKRRLKSRPGSMIFN
jgi:hypothetical protein